MVEGVQIISGAEVFGDSILRVAKGWRFESRPAASVVRLRIPFRLDGPYPSDAKLRKLTYAPTDPAEVKGTLVVGFSYVRVLIDGTGKIVGKLPVTYSSPEFRTTSDAILAMLQFEASGPKASPRKDVVVNELLIDYASDGKIRVQQRVGD
jgi:hypothetical protein